MQLVKDMPRPFCEVIVMRDIEELSYKEISIVTGLPLRNGNVAALSSTTEITPQTPCDKPEVKDELHCCRTAA
jgi:hypothetical protein